MYEIYQTKAYILRSYTNKEADQRVLIFSQGFGLIWANASGSKKEISKFRNFLQPLTEVNIFLVKGKSGYIITGGEFIQNIYFDLKDGNDIFSKKVVVVKNIFSLLEKVFLHNEEDKNIFKLLKSFLNSLRQIEEEKVLKEKEVLFLSKLFYLWGYFDKNELLEKVEEVSLEKKFKEVDILALRKKINDNIYKIAF